MANKTLETNFSSDLNSAPSNKHRQAPIYSHFAPLEIEIPSSKRYSTVINNGRHGLKKIGLQSINHLVCVSFG